MAPNLTYREKMQWTRQGPPKLSSQVLYQLSYLAIGDQIHLITTQCKLQNDET